jgi:hypothetical protein
LAKAILFWIQLVMEDNNCELASQQMLPSYAARERDFVVIKSFPHISIRRAQWFSRLHSGTSVQAGWQVITAHVRKIRLPQTA